MKPDILVIADFPNWAYYEIQQFIKNNISDEFNIYCDFLIYNTKKKTRNPIKRIKLLKEKLTFRNIKKDQVYDIVVYLGFYFDELMNITWKTNKVIKGIYTESFPPQNANNVTTILDFKKKYLRNTDALVCGSEKTKKIYQALPNINIHQASAIKDKNFFKRKLSKRINHDDTFIIGWTGNPNRPFKGFYTHIIPAIELAKKTHPNIQLKSRFSGPYKTLPFFYCDVDVILIASDADVGPSLFSEASLMEVPAISTNVGLPSRVIKNYKNGIIVNRDVKDLANKIIELYENRELVYTMSKNIRKDYLSIFDSNKIAQNWKDIFYKTLNT